MHELIFSGIWISSLVFAARLIYVERRAVLSLVAVDCEPDPRMLVGI